MKLSLFVKKYTKIYKSEFSVSFTPTKALINHKECTKTIIDLTKESRFKINTTGLPSMVSDDFADYLESAPGSN